MKLHPRRPKIIKCPLVPKMFCVNIFGTLWIHGDHLPAERLINHERIHTAQMRELLFLPFYIIYFLEWLLHLVRLRNWYAAYKAISFEREAYAHGNDLTYLPRRRHYAQWCS